jgi:hypothetical protein
VTGIAGAQKVKSEAKTVPNNCMDKSNSSSSPTSSRVTLKLKAGARKSPRESKTPPLAPSHGKSHLKPGAHWSDEYKERMQADMDALTSIRHGR